MNSSALSLEFNCTALIFNNYERVELPLSVWLGKESIKVTLTRAGRQSGVENFPQILSLRYGGFRRPRKVPDSDRSYETLNFSVKEIYLLGNCLFSRQYSKWIFGLNFGSFGDNSRIGNLGQGFSQRTQLGVFHLLQYVRIFRLAHETYSEWFTFQIFSSLNLAVMLHNRFIVHYFSFLRKMLFAIDCAFNGEELNINLRKDLS